MKIDISDLDKAAVLAALFNGASPRGMGFTHDTSNEMTLEQAREVLEGQQHFDYLGGRSFKIDLSTDEFEPWLYDRDNGGDGTAARIIESVRQTGDVTSEEIRENRRTVLAEHVAEQPEYAAVGAVVGPLVRNFQEMVSTLDLLEPPEGLTTPREYLDWASDTALSFYNEDPKKAAVVFLILVDANPHTAWIVSYSGTPMLLQIGMSSRHEMERMLKGFAA